MIFTGNFSNLEKYKKAGYVPVSIARYPIKNYFGATYTKLAPSKDMLHMGEVEYRKRYAQILSGLNKSEVLNELSKMGSNIVLICYEKEGEFCHRNLVAEWLSEVTGEIKELGDMKPKKVESNQISCF